MQILDCGQGLIEGFCMAREGTGPCGLLIYTEYQQAFCEGCARVPPPRPRFSFQGKLYIYIQCAHAILLSQSTRSSIKT